MISKFKRWELMKENLIETSRKYEGLGDLKEILKNIIDDDVEKLENLLDDISSRAEKEMIEFKTFRNSVIELSDDEANLHCEIYVYFKNRGEYGEIFNNIFNKRFEPDDWKGVHVAESIEDAKKFTKKLLDDAAKDLRFTYELKEENHREGALVPQLKTEVVISVKSLSAILVKAYEDFNRGRIQGKRYGL